MISDQFGYRPKYILGSYGHRKKHHVSFREVYHYNIQEPGSSVHDIQVLYNKGVVHTVECLAEVKTCSKYTTLVQVKIRFNVAKDPRCKEGLIFNSGTHEFVEIVVEVELIVVFCHSPTTTTSPTTKQP